MNKKLILLTSAAMLSTGIISESWAVDCAIGKKVCQTGCIDESLICEYCGPTCGYTQVGGEVTLYGTGVAFSGYNYKYIDGWGYYDSNGNRPPFYNNDTITKVKADGSSNFTSIGAGAFNKATGLKSIDMPNITSIGAGAFQSASSLESIDLSNVTSIGNSAFYWASSLKSVDLSNVALSGYAEFYQATSLTDIIISDEIDTTYWDGGIFRGLDSGTKITCWGNENTCYQKLGKFLSESTCSENIKSLCTCSDSNGCISLSKIQFPTDEQCSASENYYSSNDGCVKLPSTQDTCTSTGFLWKNNKCSKPTPIENSVTSVEETPQKPTATSCANNGKVLQEGACVSSCGASFKLNDGECDRQRYTPAEAAQVLHNDNTNEVTITFKK